MKTFCVIGMNRFGQTLALTLAKNKKQVMIIDENAEIVGAMADFVTDAVVGDPKNEEVLVSAGAADYDCTIVCYSGEIDDSILITLLLKDIGASYVVARAQSDLHMRILTKVGADRVVYPEKDMGERLANTLTRNNVMEYIELSDDCSIVEIKVPAKWVGRSLAELDVRRKYQVTIIAIGSQEGKVDVSPDPNTLLDKDMTVTVIGLKKNIERIS